MADRVQPPLTLIVDAKARVKGVLHRTRHEYELVLFRVEARNEDGTPFQVTVARMDDVLELSQDETKNHMFFGYMPICAFKKQETDDANS